MSSLLRRSFLTGAATLIGAAMTGRPTIGQISLPILRAAPASAQLAPAGYPSTPAWAYATEGKSTVPGPEIRVMAGERIRYRLTNDLPQSTAVHWHGIRIENAMDGAAPLTQAPVPPGGTFDYDFIAPDPGTYWYHAHNRSAEQVARGLAGLLIVEDREPWLGLPGAATRELVLVLDDWLLDSDAAVVEDRWDDLHAAAHGGRMGNTITMNGVGFESLPLRPGERVRLRILNAATDRIMPLNLAGLSPHLIALDGHPVQPRKIETFTLGPAQRADVVIDAPLKGKSAGFLIDLGNGEWLPLATFVIEGDAISAQTVEVRPLPPWRTLSAPDLENARREILTMEGGAMRAMLETRYQGKTMDFRELAENGMVWAFNRAANDMETPMFRASVGQTIRLELTNRTGFPHAIHLHGHHFTVLAQSGSANMEGDVRDTVLVDADETVEIAFVADNPGAWMVHCHMLSHQKTGMMAWFEVV